MICEQFEGDEMSIKMSSFFLAPVLPTQAMKTSTEKLNLGGGSYLRPVRIFSDKMFQPKKPLAGFVLWLTYSDP